MRRWLVALAAVAAGGLASAGVLAAGSGGGGRQTVYVAARDLPAGATLDSSALGVATVRLGAAQAGLALRPGGAPVFGRRASHDLLEGQIIQRGDVRPASDRRLVLVAIRELPPVRPGDRVDLFTLGDAAHPLVSPFAAGVEVAAVAPGALVLSVPARQAPAFVFAGSMAVAAVVVSGGGRSGSQPVATAAQAAELIGS